MEQASENPIVSPPQKMRDLFGYNAAMADDELSFATARCIYALDRRDRLEERVRFGCLALNSAALLALLTAGGSKEDKLASLGVSSGTVAIGAAFFIIGAMMAALAIWASTRHFIRVTGPEIGNLYAARAKKALFDSLPSEDAGCRVSAALDEPVHEMGDFKFSPVEMFLTNMSGCMWLTGAGVVLFAMVRRIAGGFCA